MNGIGGSTIAEAKRRLGYDEYLTWAAYRRERGSLSVGRRIEQAVGYLSFLTTAVNSKSGSKIDVLDFMPHEPKPTQEQELIDAFKVFGGVK